MHTNLNITKAAQEAQARPARTYYEEVEVFDLLRSGLAEGKFYENGDEIFISVLEKDAIPYDAGYTRLQFVVVSKSKRECDFDTHGTLKPGFYPVTDGMGHFHPCFYTGKRLIAIRSVDAKRIRFHMGDCITSIPHLFNCDKRDIHNVTKKI